MFRRSTTGSNKPRALPYPILLLPLLIACNLPVVATTPGHTAEPGNTATPALDDVLLATVVAATMQALIPSVTPTSALPSPTLTATATATSTATPTLMPTSTLAATLTRTPTDTPAPGSIAGGIYGYPYGNIPRLVIVAFHQERPYYWWLIIAAGSTWYSMDNYIPPGRYQVVAYDAAGHAGGCPSIVTVKSGQTATCDITDWGGSYRAKPSGVPSP